MCAFSSVHTDTSLILMEELERAGVSGYAGKVSMDRYTTDELIETTENGLNEERSSLRRAFQDSRGANSDPALHAQLYGRYAAWSWQDSGGVRAKGTIAP